jgi:hypothetical protein
MGVDDLADEESAQTTAGSDGVVDGADAAAGDAGSGLPGRQRSHRGDGRPRRLTPRFTEAEFAEVVAAAASIGMTPNGFVADSAVAAARGTPLVLADAQRREEFARLQRQLFEARTAVNRFGTNVNQAVAALNATGQTPEWLVQAVRLAVRSVQRLDEVIAEVDRRLR